MSSFKPVNLAHAENYKELKAEAHRHVLEIRETIKMKVMANKQEFGSSKGSAETAQVTLRGQSGSMLDRTKLEQAPLTAKASGKKALLWGGHFPKFRE